MEVIKTEEKAKEAVSVIYQSCQKLAMVIEDFLDITRIELKGSHYNRCPFCCLLPSRYSGSRQKNFIKIYYSAH